MKYIEKVQQIVKEGLVDNMSPTDYLIWVAYWIGREDSCRTVSDDYAALLEQQWERAQNCRYYNMAMQVQGNVKHLYHDDYSQSISITFGEDEFVDPTTTPEFQKTENKSTCIILE